MINLSEDNNESRVILMNCLSSEEGDLKIDSGLFQAMISVMYFSKRNITLSDIQDRSDLRIHFGNEFTL